MKIMFSIIRKDPFRIYFPAAITCLLYGSVMWILYGIFEIGDIPIQLHATFFFAGFLNFSILGFLLTAIPRFTQTEHLSKVEFSICLILLFLSIFSLYLQREIFIWGSVFFSFLFLIFFGGSRFFKRTQNPPFSFIFVGLGLLLGLIGSLFISLSFLSIDHFYFLEDWGKLFIYDGMVTSFIFGVGGRLIPGILGFNEIVKLQRDAYEKKVSFIKVIPFSMWLALLLYLVSLILDGFGYYFASYMIRALVVTYFSFNYWRIHKKVESNKWHGKMIKVSCWFLLVASWILCFNLDNMIHNKHLIYLGTYCLLTIMVSSRVILAHGENKNLDYEYRKNPYLVIGGLIAFAAVTRATAFLLPDSYENHLGYAGLLLIIAIIYWTYLFILGKRK